MDQVHQHPAAGNTNPFDSDAYARAVANHNTYAGTIAHAAASSFADHNTDPDLAPVAYANRYTDLYTSTYPAAYYAAIAHTNPAIAGEPPNEPA